MAEVHSGHKTVSSGFDIYKDSLTCAGSLVSHLIDICKGILLKQGNTVILRPQHIIRPICVSLGHIFNFRSVRELCIQFLFLQFILPTRQGQQRQYSQEQYLFHNSRFTRFHPFRSDFQCRFHKALLPHRFQSHQSAEQNISHQFSSPT